MSNEPRRYNVLAVVLDVSRPEQFIEVVEAAAYDALREREAELVEALRFYAEGNADLSPKDRAKIDNLVKALLECKA